jgi:cell wall assembly regulator SMI1
MDDADFDRVEKDLGLRLPDAYRSVLRDAPKLSRYYPEVIVVDATVVVALNREFRDGEFSADWQAHWLAIGTEANGDVLFIDLQEPVSPVFSWDHETHEVRTEAASMAALAQRAREEAASF